MHLHDAPASVADSYFLYGHAGFDRAAPLFYKRRSLLREQRSQVDAWDQHVRCCALRAQAEAILGARFDRREFHDLLLGSGAVSLDVLEALVHTWIDTQG